MDRLPVELMGQIASLLNFRDFLSLALTHRRAASIARAPSVTARVYYNTWGPDALWKIMNRRDRIYDIFTILLKIIPNPPQNVIDKALVSASIDVKMHIDAINVLWQLKPSESALEEVLIIVAQRGNLEILERILESTPNIGQYAIENALIGASEFGHLNIVNRLLQLDRRNYKWVIDRALEAASLNYHQDVLIRLRTGSRGRLFDASIDGNLDLIKTIFKLKFQISQEVIDAGLGLALDEGRINVVEYLRQLNSTPNQS